MKHGISRYNRGCRCEVCKAAKARAWRRYASCRRCGERLANPALSRVCGLCLEEGTP